jgi:4-hydroxybenzoate polyprenyltransferase
MPATRTIAFLNQSIKLQSWWIPKIAPGVFTWILFSIILKNQCDFNTSTNVFLLFFILIILAVFGHLINDYSDFHSDEKAGKSNLFNKIGFKNRQWVFSSLLLIISIASYFLPTEIRFLVFIQILLNCAYSLAPIRLKEKGWWSLIITGFYERTVPYLMIIFSIIPIHTIQYEQVYFLVPYLFWALFWEFRNFMNGQVEDKENDVKAKLKTLAITVQSSALNKVKTVFLSLELLALISWYVTWIFWGDSTVLLFLLLNSLIVLIHIITIKDLFYIRHFERFLDFLYCYSFLSSLVIYSLIVDAISPLPGACILLLFISSYTFASLKFVYQKIFFVASFAVNHAIYYLRKIF